MRINQALKAKMRAEGLQYEGDLRPLDPMAEYRLVPSLRLIARLGIEAYNILEGFEGAPDDNAGDVEPPSGTALPRAS